VYVDVDVDVEFVICSLYSLLDREGPMCVRACFDSCWYVLYVQYSI
jgi:hypothetical protein